MLAYPNLKNAVYWAAVATAAIVGASNIDRLPSYNAENLRIQVTNAKQERADYLDHVVARGADGFYDINDLAVAMANVVFTNKSFNGIVSNPFPNPGINVTGYMNNKYGDKPLLDALTAAYEHANEAETPVRLADSNLDERIEVLRGKLSDTVSHSDDLKFVDSQSKRFQGGAGIVGGAVFMAILNIFTRRKRAGGQ